MINRELSKQERIRSLNDAMRRYGTGGYYLITAGVRALPHRIQQQALMKVKHFNDFKEGNNPYGEHDFGSFKLNGYTFFWKIDVHDRHTGRAPKDPSDPENTMRALTIMLAEEY